MGTLADLVQGFQGGYTGVQDARRKRKINQAIDYELGQSEEARIGRQMGRERFGYGEGYEGADFTMPQTWGEKLVGKIKSAFGSSTGQQSVTAIDPAMQPAGLQQSGATTFPMPERFRDGGAVRNMKRYANGGRSLPTDRSTAHGASRYHVENPIPGLANGGPTPGVPVDTQMGAYAVQTPNAMMQSQSVPQAIPFADGGDVRRHIDPETGVEFINGVPQSKVPTSAGVSDAVAAVGNRLAEMPGKAFPNVAAEGRRYGEMERVRRKTFQEAETAEDIGAAGREYLGEGLLSAGVQATALADDLLGPIDEAIASGARGIKGALGYGTTAANERVAAQGAETAAVTAAVNPDAPVAAQPTGDPPNTQTPQAKAAAQPAGPPEEIVDFTQVRDISPEDMPNHGVKDWEDERRFWAAQAISLGNDPFEAMKAVDQRQMRGFTSYGQQAFQMLQAGDATGAARALYAAYQYFPNGADVRFGVQKGANGQPVLIGMGKDEETGEPLKEGKPMVITPESLSVQLENMSNPSAFRTWTKDWRTMEQEIREYDEVTKQEAESNARYRDRMGRAAEARAAASVAGGGRGGLRQTDYDRANSAFMEAVELEGFENPAQADAMMDMMAQIYDRYAGQVQYPTIIRDVRDAIRSGDHAVLDQKYGL